MREKKWTPGKWVVDENGNVIVEGSGGGVGYPPTEGTIASLCDGEYIVNENGDNDARLIAAAPDLVEALEGLARMHRERFGLDGAYDSEIRIAETALAKAYGDQP